MMMMMMRQALVRHPAHIHGRHIRLFRRHICGISDPDSLPPVTIVQDRDTALRVLAQLRALGPDHIHACDTEVADIDLKKVGPVGNGHVTCLSIFSGPSHDFGNGPRIWIDNLDSAGGTLEYFREFLEDPETKKVWHNYSFDRHVIYNHDRMDVRGLGGDTMHMARLWNTARFQQGGYSLASLSADCLQQAKKPMKELFGIPKLRKDGTAGKALLMPSVRELQRSAESREKWIRYSTFDAECTWYLHEFLKAKLQEMVWFQDVNEKGKVIHAASMYEFYTKYIVPFGECLTDIERKGMHLDLEYLAKVEIQAVEDSHTLRQDFLHWAKRYLGEDAAKHMNVHSAAQKQQFLFAPYVNDKGEELLPLRRDFQIENLDEIIEPGKTKPLKTRPLTISGLGIPSIKQTAGKLPTVGAEVLRTLAGYPHRDPPQYGKAYDHFGGGEEGKDACVGLDALCNIASNKTMITNFIQPLQNLADAQGRVHGSLNLNTDTGRLSSRRPNLQNQPALEKDRYKIRDAFTAPPGKLLIVADYSQLELRLLAHITNCRGMIDAFREGGDFHSRTAMSMYDYVAKAVAEGKVLLEWDSSKGQAPVPLLKDTFATERKNAKILNFSIAYGKTAFGLAKDFKVSRKEAAETLDRWYQDRPEVKVWQERAIRTANLFGYTRTLMGRYRMLPDAMLSNKRAIGAKQARAHAERAAINTPIQGAAADVVMQAMLKIHHDPILKELQWAMVCQIHDEVIVEGPEESAKDACARVVQLMEHPFEDPLSVALEVEAKVDSSWYKAK